MNVVFPRPDSPATMMVKAAPLLATILCLWFGYPEMLDVVHNDLETPGHRTLTRFAMPIGDALSVVGGAIFSRLIVLLFKESWCCGVVSGVRRLE